MNLAVSDLKLRYRRSFLGFLWTLLNPLLMMVVLTAVFSTIMRFSVKDYSILLFAGLLPWTFFSQSVMGSLMSVVGKGPLLRKVYIPKAVIPLSAVLATFVNFVLSFVPLLLVAVTIGHPITAALWFVPVASIMLFLFATGFAFLFACLNVFFRDFGHMTEVLLQAWFYFSPVIYTPALLPEKYRPLFAWNPMSYLIACFRDPIFSGTWPHSSDVLGAAASAVCAMVLGYVIFQRYEGRFVYRV